MPKIEIVVPKSVQDALGVELDMDELNLRLEARVNTDLFAKRLGITDEKEIKRLYDVVLYKMRKAKEETHEEVKKNMTPFFVSTCVLKFKST